MNSRSTAVSVGAAVLAVALALSVAGGALAAEEGGLVFNATGTVTNYVQLASSRALFEGLPAEPDLLAACQAITLLSAESPGLLLRLRFAATAEADRSSSLNPQDFSNAVFLDLREAETAILPSPSLALRGGLLLRNFGIGSYGSPVNPFSRGPDQGGFWGLDAEVTPGTSLSALAIVSGDRALRAGRLAGLADFDSGALVRYSPGVLDAAAGAYASGSGAGELRPVGYLSLPLASFLASLEAALSLPLRPGEGGRQESLRFELRKSLALGELSLEAGAAYRGIYPGRSADDIAALAASIPAGGLPADPFAPFYGRHYVEFSLFAERTNAFALSMETALQLPWGSLSGDARLDIYVGEASLFFRVQAIAGLSDGEFNALARAQGQPLLVFWSGMEFSF